MLTCGYVGLLLEALSNENQQTCAPSYPLNWHYSTHGQATEAHEWHNHIQILERCSVCCVEQFQTALASPWSKVLKQLKVKITK